MDADRNPGRLERILSKAEAEEPTPEIRQSVWTQARATIRRRIITGVLFLIPIAVTIWLVNFVLTKIYFRFEPIIRPMLESWGMETTDVAYKTVGILLSILAVLIFLYLVGLITARTAVRRLIGLGEWIVGRIPFVKFVYKTVKQIVDTIALSSSGALQKVVVIEYPRPGIRTVAFVTGRTKIEGESEPCVNLFVPTTPNPTSGYMVILSPSEVCETNMTIDEAMKFIVSGGILPPELLKTMPFGASSTAAAKKRSVDTPETSPPE
ncbi:hypothetical protein AMJ85_08705 [candidate division BRC1 bacterium SM23_51]|nr:MAG: hypothetical protein AMJ85_08705 [candidate division BRC1 bacterium SM23_51]